jgi:hypothetical protein
MEYSIPVMSILLYITTLLHAGKARVATPVTVGVLVALLPVATPRVQRQLLVILRRVLMLVDPKVGCVVCFVCGTHWVWFYWYCHTFIQMWPV